ncbi:hypothetical protein A2U01_0105860, partial [Trifolium medium]|nr:hypothetical protein [Trifolium medium]
MGCAERRWQSQNVLPKFYLRWTQK